jgi:uncharacterized protein YegJ (DUF2314 family)
MPHRDDGNIRFTCSEHSPKPDPKWAKKAPEWFQGKFVKKAFKVETWAEGAPDMGATVEHMWVRVTGTNKSCKLTGTLANSPAFALHLKFGAKVTVSLAEIEDVEVAAIEYKPKRKLPDANA